MNIRKPRSFTRNGIVPINAHDAFRAALTTDVETFLARGGQITSLAVHESAFDFRMEKLDATSAGSTKRRYKNPATGLLYGSTIKCKPVDKETL